MKIPRHPLACAALAAALVPATACGGTDGAAEEAPETTASAEPSPTEEIGLAGVVEGLADNTHPAASFTLEITATGAGSDSEVPDTTSTYEVQGPKHPDRVTATMPEVGRSMLQSLEMSGQNPGLTAEELGTVTMILEPDGEVPLIANHHGAFPGGTEWVRGPEGIEAFPPPPMIPSALAPLLKDMADDELVAHTGAQNVDGTEAELVEGEAQQAEIEELGGSREYVEELLGGSAAGKMTLAAWIDDDEGLPVRVEVSDDEVEMELVFSEISDTSFDMPDQDEIHTM